jgi:hypothetical protein
MFVNRSKADIAVECVIVRKWTRNGHWLIDNCEVVDLARSELA